MCYEYIRGRRIGRHSSSPRGQRPLTDGGARWGFSRASDGGLLKDVNQSISISILEPVGGREGGRVPADLPMYCVMYFAYRHPGDGYLVISCI